MAKLWIAVAMLLLWGSTARAVEEPKPLTHQQAREQAGVILDSCEKKIYSNDPQSKSGVTVDIIAMSQKVNNCLKDALKKEMRKGFDSEEEYNIALKKLDTYLEAKRDFYDEAWFQTNYASGTLNMVVFEGNTAGALLEALEFFIFKNSGGDL
mgnify:CR=1 FL=1